MALIRTVVGEYKWKQNLEVVVRILHMYTHL